MCKQGFPLNPFLKSWSVHFYFHVFKVYKKPVSVHAVVDKVIPDIILKTQNSKLENNVDYLGLTFDIPLIWNLHIARI